MIKNVVKAELRSVTMKEFTRKNGDKGFDYSILLEQDGNSFISKTNVDVFNQFMKGEIIKGQIYEFVAIFYPRWQFNNYVIDGVNK